MTRELTTITIHDVDDDRLALFRELRDPLLLRQRRRFIAESRQVVRRLLRDSTFATESLLLSPDALAAVEEVIPRTSPPAIYVADRALLRAVAGFKVHRGCLAVGVRGPLPAPLSLLPRDAPWACVIALEAVSDPDNVGSIFRSAAAFGAAALWLDPHSADPLYRKAIRTSMGHTLTLPFARCEGWPAPLAEARARGWRVVALTPDGRDGDLAAIAAASPPRPTLLVVGNEGHGLTDETLAMADMQVGIAMIRGVDSLNVAVATAVALHQLGPGGAPR